MKKPKINGVEFPVNPLEARGYRLLSDSTTAGRRVRIWERKGKRGKGK